MAIAHEDIIAIFNKVKFPYNISKLTASVAHKALDNINLMEANVKSIAEQKERIIEELEKIPTVRKVIGEVVTSACNLIGHFTVVYLVAKPLIWSEAEGDLAVIETCI